MMIEQSPGLVELSLRLPGESSYIICQLKEPLPRLRSLELDGGYPQPARDVDGTANNSLGAFFRRHPHLTNVALLWAPSFRPTELPPVDPALMPSLFPSVTNFDGPIRVCMGLVASEVAEQLEALKVEQTLHIHSNNMNGRLDDPISALAGRARPLPNLKSLEFGKTCTCMGGHIDKTALDKLLTATPALTFLGMGPFPAQWVSLVIQLAPISFLNLLVIST